MKKLFNYTFVAIVAFFMALIFPTNALTKFDLETWTSDSGYGSVTEVKDGILNIKGNDLVTGGMKLGPFSKASTAKLDDDITEELYVELDPESMTHGELFEVSLALKNGAGEYVTEDVITVVKNGDAIEITSPKTSSTFKYTVTEKNVYTFRWEVTKEGAKTYVSFTVLDGIKELATTGKTDFDLIVTGDTKNPIASETDVSVKYIWFCNVQTANGVNVYVEAPVKVQTKEFEAEGITFESETELPNNYVLNIDEKEAQEVAKANELVVAAYKDNKEVEDAALLALYDINFTQNSEVVEVKDGKFVISIDLDEKLQDYDHFKVVYINDEGKIEETLDAKLVDGKIVFETTHLSTYGIVGYNNADTTIVNPDTFDTTTIYAALILITLSAGALAVIKLKREN